MALQELNRMECVVDTEISAPIADGHDEEIVDDQISTEIAGEEEGNPL